MCPCVLAAAAFPAISALVSGWVSFVPGLISLSVPIQIPLSHIWRLLQNAFDCCRTNFAACFKPLRPSHFAFQVLLPPALRANPQKACDSEAKPFSNHPCLSRHLYRGA